MNPDAVEVPYDGVDQDCAGGDLTDADGDGFDVDEECDDGDAAVNPDAPDTVGNGVDDDCDGIDGVDGDLDGFASSTSGGTDCADADPLRNPDATEVWYDGLDQDCDRQCDYDQDGDLAVLLGSPVNDGSPCDTDPAAGRVAFDEDCDDTDAAAATTVVQATLPVDGSVTAGVGTVVRATLSADEPTAAVTLYDPAGNAVAGTSVAATNVVTFTPSAPLTEGATYTAEVAFSCGPESWSFTTVAPVDPASLVGRVWEADIAGGNWVEPPGVGPLFAPLVAATALVTVTAEATDSLDFRAASAVGGVQELCSPTTDLLGADFTGNPSFFAGPTDLTLSALGADLSVANATISGTFTGSGSDISVARLEGELDTRALDPALGLGPGGTCALIVVFGVPCTPCSDGTGPYCLWLEVEDIPTPEVVGGSVVPRTDADIAADPGCP